MDFSAEKLERVSFVKLVARFIFKADHQSTSEFTIDHQANWSLMTQTLFQLVGEMSLSHRLDPI